MYKIQNNCKALHKVKIYFYIIISVILLLVSYFIINFIVKLQNNLGKTSLQLIKLMKEIEEDVEEISPALLETINQTKKTLQQFDFSSDSNEATKSTSSWFSFLF